MGCKTYTIFCWAEHTTWTTDYPPTKITMMATMKATMVMGKTTSMLKCMTWSKTHDLGHPQKIVNPHLHLDPTHPHDKDLMDTKICAVGIAKNMGMTGDTTGDYAKTNDARWLSHMGTTWKHPSKILDQCLPPAQLICAIPFLSVCLTVPPSANLTCASLDVI